jgi:hypothetical protein
MRHFWKLSVLLSALLALSGCTVWGEHPVKSWQDATGAEGLERSYWHEVKGQNWQALDRHLAGNYVSFTPEEGRLDRAAAVQHLQGLHLDDYSLGDFETEMNGSTLVVTYTIRMRGTYDGQPLPADPVRMMTVWQQQKIGWLAIAHSVIGPAKP